MSPLVLTDKVRQHAILTLNRPDKLNALSYELIDALMQALDVLEADAQVRCVIITGQGRKAFSAGADIAGFAADVLASPERALERFCRRGQGLTSRIERFGKPVIAAVNGLAYGGGCEVVEACGLAVAADHSRFAKPEISLGFPPPFGGSQRLPRHVGRKRALAMMLTGEAIDARHAERIGLVNEVVPIEELMEACLGLADRIARHSAVAVAATLRAVTRGINLPIDEALHAEAAQFMIAVASPGVREGLQAFFERRHR
jgi:enoyl-CoA hydratase/carnithine racemase